jgi:hypothetical protein
MEKIALEQYLIIGFGYSMFQWLPFEMEMKLTGRDEIGLNPAEGCPYHARTVKIDCLYS